MIGSIIGGALGIGSAIFGGLSASKAIKGAKKDLEKQQRENSAWFDRRYNEDATQRADAQRILAKTEESIRNRNRQASGAAAVMGATPESVAAAKAQNNEALAEATSQIAAAGDRRKDQIEQQYLQTKSDISNRLNNLEIQKAQNIANVVQGVAGVGSSIAGLDFGSNKLPKGTGDVSDNPNTTII